VEGQLKIGLNLLAGVLFSALLCNSMWAQSTAQINGIVKDQTGALLPGTEVSATQTATGAKRSVVTDETGSYVLTNLPIGPYMLEVSLPGFRTYVQTGIVLQVNSNPTISVVLQVGQITEQIEVQANTALVETRSVGVGAVIDNQRVLELPLNGRNATELIFMAGIANPGVGVGSINSVRNYPTVVVSVAGGIGNGITFLLDGANHNDSMNNLNLPLPFPDALQEFKVETSALPAQYGYHSSAAVNAVTKSGTNQFHGDAFEFVRNGVFNARNFFATSRDSLKRNQFGGVIGGPIKKNKLFFFGGYQGTIQRSDPPQTIAYVPTPAMLAGDFTAFASPACQGRQVTLPAAQGFVNNQISPSRFDPAALIIDKRLPMPTDLCGKLTYGLKTNSEERLAVAKVDYQKSEKQSMFARLTISNFNTPSTYDGKNALTVNTNFAHDRVYSLALGDTYIFGSDIVSSLRIGVTRTELPKIPDDFASWKDLGVNANSFQAKNPRISVPGTGFAIGSGASIVNIANTGPNYNIAEDISMVRSKHQFGFGANYIFTLMNLDSGVNATGVMTFNGSVSGLPLVDFLMGNASSWAQGNANFFYNRQNYLGLYAQDLWKVSPKFTVNYGLRWEPYFPIHSKYGYFNHFDPALFKQNFHSSVYVNAPAGEVFPGDPQYPCGKSVECRKWAAFAPRLGVVWDPKGDGKMAIRAAYGMFTDRANIYSLTAFGQDAPYGNIITLTNVKLSEPWANYPGGNPLPIPLNKDISFPIFGGYVTHPYHFKPTYIHQWNLSIQRQLGTDWLITANYIGSSTIHLTTGENLNPAEFLGLGPCTLNTVTGPMNVPQCSTTNNTNQRRRLYREDPAKGQFYAVIAQAEDGGTGSYSGLLLSANKRLSHGVNIGTNYTWGHCISDQWDVFVGNGGASSVTPGDRRNDRGNCATSDQRQALSLSAVAQTPKFSNKTLARIAGSWQVSPSMRIRSAQFFTVTTGVDNALSGQGGQRPNLVQADPYPTKKTIENWINRSAFASPEAGTYGRVSPFNMKGPSTFQLDLAISRTFTLREGRTLQLRAEGFNLPNHTNLKTPVSALNSGNFGQIQSANDPRILQFATKFIF